MVKFRRTDSELREKKVVNYYQSGWYEDLTLGEVSLHGKDVVNYYQGGWYRDLTLGELSLYINLRLSSFAKSLAF